MKSALEPINRRILVIDDSAAIHEDFKKILARAPDSQLASLEAELFEQPAVPAGAPRFELTSAMQGQEGLALTQAALAAGRPFALAFVDVRMPPGWDGIETITRLWEADPALEVVICTAHSDYSWVEIIKRLTSPEKLLILKKPFDVIEVLQLAHTLTEKWRLAQQSKHLVRRMKDAIRQRTQELHTANSELSQLALDRQRTAQRLERANHLYSALSKINELVVRATSVETLARDACRSLVEDGMFRLVWFGTLDRQSRLIRPSAFAGFEDGYLSQMTFSADPDSRNSRGPVGKAFLSGSVSVCNQLDEPEFEPWRAEARKRGYASLAAFPLKTENGVVGMLALYSSEPGFFNEPELQLLNQLSADLSFATQFLEQAGWMRLQAAALSAAKNSIVITDPNGVVLWLNNSFSELTGYSAAETRGRKISLLKSGRHSLEFYQGLWRTISAGQPWHGEIINRRKDGRCLTCESTITPVTEPDGAITHYISIQQDITARKQSEARVQAFAALGKNLNTANSSRAAAELIVEVADQLLGWDACFFELFSPAEGLLTDILIKDVIDGRRTEIPCDPGFHPPTELAVRALREGGVLLLRGGTEFRPDGVPFGDQSRPSASIVFVPIRNGSEPIGLLSIQSYTPNAYDQASLDTLQALADHCAGALGRIKAQENLRQTQEQLRQSQKLEAIGQLAGGVAHDFNNLLAVIRGNAELVLMDGDQLPPVTQECLRQITSASDRAANLTQQLLIFGRKQLMQARAVDLNDLVGNLTKMLKRIVGEHISFHCDYAAQAPYVHADSGMLEQVLVNLVVNARDAMPTGGRLVLGTGLTRFDATHPAKSQEARAGLFATLCVQDSGTGIAPEILPRIFEPFFTTKDIGKGTGLGLSTVYGIAKQHSGWVEVSSQAGVGSSFTVFLPAIPRPQTQAGTGSSAPAPAGGSERILLVEDDDTVRSLTRSVLEKFGYHVREASSGPQALESYADCADEFDLLLTDMVMPLGLTGREVAERFRQRKPGIKVLFTSGYSGDSLGQDTAFLSRTRTHFLAKPASPQQLLEAVRRCLDAPQPELVEPLPLPGMMV